jgi:hypothetical protein
MVDEPFLKISIFRMFPDVQLKLVTDFALFTAKNLYESRKEIVGLFDKDGNLVEDYKEKLPSASQSIDILKRFRNPRIWLDSFVKSYGMMWITNRLGEASRHFKKEGFTSFFWAIQIAGGYPFAFWWKDLLEKGTSFQKGESVITGVSNGDEHYPLMSAAGTISTSLMRNVDKLHHFSVQPIDIDDSFDLYNFFEGHSKALDTPIFQKRVIFIGKMSDNVRMCIPYLMHTKDIYNTHEATSITVPIQWFFKHRGYGKADNTTIVHSDSLSTTDKENIKFCKGRKYPIKHISEFKEDFEVLLSKVSSEIDYAPTQKRTKLSTTLKKIETECLGEME